MIEFFSQPWPWYVAGPLIGLTVPLLLIFGNKPFGLSSSFRHLCAAILPGNIEYLKYKWKDEIWSFFFLTGTVIGGFIGTQLIGNPKPIAISSSTFLDLAALHVMNFNGLVPSDVFSFSNLFTIQGFVFIILGGFMIGFGTRYADGCTSGHAISGLSNLQSASLIAVMGFFIGGLFITHLVMPFLF